MPNQTAFCFSPVAVWVLNWEEGKETRLSPRGPLQHMQTRAQKKPVGQEPEY